MARHHCGIWTTMIRRASSRLTGPKCSLVIQRQSMRSSSIPRAPFSPLRLMTRFKEFAWLHLLMSLLDPVLVEYGGPHDSSKWVASSRHFNHWMGHGRCLYGWRWLFAQVHLFQYASNWGAAAFVLVSWKNEKRELTLFYLYYYPLFECSAPSQPI